MVIDFKLCIYGFFLFMYDIFLNKFISYVYIFFGIRVEYIYILC